MNTEPNDKQSNDDEEGQLRQAVVMPRSFSRGDKVRWKGWACKVVYVRKRSKTLKVQPDFTRPNFMPYSYYWLDFADIDQTEA
jgi:hypothetical protein